MRKRTMALWGVWGGSSLALIGGLAVDSTGGNLVSCIPLWGVSAIAFVWGAWWLLKQKIAYWRTKAE